MRLCPECHYPTFSADQRAATQEGRCIRHRNEAHDRRRARKAARKAERLEADS